MAVLLASAGRPLPQPMPLIQAPALVRATPALWEIRDADTTIYLFGTFHTLDGRTAWFDHKVRDAFDASGELVLETVVPADMSRRARRQVTETRPGRQAQAQSLHRPDPDRDEPEANSAGMSVENGADTVLRRVAEDVGKPVSGLERFEDQLKTLSNIPAPPPASAAAATTVAPAIGHRQ